MRDCTRYRHPNIETSIVDDQSIWSGLFRAQMNFEARNEGTSFVFGQR